MKCFSVIVCLTGFGLMPVLDSQAQETAPAPALENAEVRIPYAELKKLLTDAQGARSGPAVRRFPEGILLSSVLRANLASGKLAVEGEFRLESFAGNWERIRLMGASMTVASVEPPDARLIVAGEDLFFVAQESGPVSLKIKFAEIPVPSSPKVPFLDVTTAPSAVALLEIRGVPEDRSVLLEDGSPLTATPEGGVLRLSFSAMGGPVALSLAEGKIAPRLEPAELPVQPSQWSLQSEVLVTEGEGELCYRARVNVSALNGSALEAVLLLPPNARSVVVTGEDLLESRSARTPEGLTELRLKWKTRDIMERQLQVSYALLQMPLASEWVLRGPAMAGHEENKTLFMFELSPGVEFSGPAIQGPVVLQKLPRWVAAESKAPEFGTVMAASTVTLQSKILPRLETAVGVITSSEYSTRLVGDGAVLTTGTVEIEHDAALRWSFSLPEKSELLKCNVDGSAVKPIARENGVMEIPLPFAAASSKSVTSTVTFSYTEVKERLHAVEGQTALELPLTPLFIKEVLWTVEIPESYQVTGVGEGIEYASKELLSPSSDNEAHTVRLSRKLCRNERPQAQLFYQRRGLTE